MKTIGHGHLGGKNLHIIHAHGKGGVSAGVQNRIHPGILAGKKGLDRSVLHVAHPARKGSVPSLPQHKSPKTNTLHTAMEPEVERLHGLFARHAVNSVL